MNAVRSELVAVLIAVDDGVPMVLTLEGGRALPSGPLETAHRSLQTGMRLWVERQTGHRLGHVEQLYTFADTPDRHESRTIRISYMALTRIGIAPEGWKSWYAYFPWEDRSTIEGRMALAGARARLDAWAKSARDLEKIKARIDQTFGTEGGAWDDERVLQRYELLWEAGLVAESRAATGSVVAGEAMVRDHRRILATAMTRLRAKIRYRPVIFELMPEAFTFLELQRTVEAVAGQEMHKQNFRRLIQQQQLVEETTELSREGPGRPARLFRFRREIIGDRQAAGSKLPLMRSV